MFWALFFTHFSRLPANFSANFYTKMRLTRPCIAYAFLLCTFLFSFLDCFYHAGSSFSQVPTQWWSNYKRAHAYKPVNPQSFYQGIIPSAIYIHKRVSNNKIYTQLYIRFLWFRSFLAGRSAFRQFRRRSFISNISGFWPRYYMRAVV